MVDGGAGFDTVQLSGPSFISWRVINDADGIRITVDVEAGFEPVLLGVERLLMVEFGRDKFSEGLQIGTDVDDVIDGTDIVLSSSSDRVTFYGFNGDDVITANPNHRSQIYGGDGDDIMTGGAGQSGFYLGLGNDTLIATSASSGMYVENGDLDVTVDMEAGFARTTDLSVNVTFNNLFYIYTGDGDDTFLGYGGNDTFYSGDDTLVGGAGSTTNSRVVLATRGHGRGRAGGRFGRRHRPRGRRRPDHGLGRVRPRGRDLI